MDLNYQDAIRFLYGLRLFGAKLGLENSHRLAALAGRPQDRLRFIHVAGTNGKGSTCAMLESIHRAAGRRVGLFTSPHLVSFRERIQVDRTLIPEDDVARLVTRLRGWCAEFPPDHHPTFFEVVTVLALCWFEERRCDLVVWETGLGGRLDATNIVTPLASVITNIQFDHEKWLGHTLAEIAAEKAGIIKPGIPALTAATEPEAVEVIVARAQVLGAPLIRLGAAEPVARGCTVPEELPLLGEHQRVNAQLAVATVEVLQDALPVDPEAISRGLATVAWPGRFQLLQREDGRCVILDGAHNPAGARVLVAALGRHFPGRRPTLVLGILADKDWRAMCDVLAPCAGTVLPVLVSSERTASPQELAEACHAANAEARVTACQSLGEALRQCAEDPLVLIAGSLYLVGEALESLAPQGGPVAGERGLNEWTAAGAVQR